MNLSDLFSVTLSQGVAWLVSFGIAALVAYVLGWFPSLSEGAKKIISGVAVATLAAFVTAVANNVPQTWMDMKLFDAAVALISIVVGMAGSLFGGFKANTHYTQNTSVLGIKSMKAMALLTFLSAALLTTSLMGGASVAFADAPAYQYGLIQCSGLALPELAVANQRFDTWYGWSHQLTTPQQWQASYITRVNEFASTLGCPKVLLDDNTPAGALTLPYRIYDAWFSWYLTGGPQPQ